MPTIVKEKNIKNHKVFFKIFKHEGSGKVYLEVGISKSLQNYLKTLVVKTVRKGYDYNLDRYGIKCGYLISHESRILASTTLIEEGKVVIYSGNYKSYINIIKNIKKSVNMETRRNAYIKKYGVF